MTHARTLTAIDRHFARRLDVRGESEMRAHLSGCAACRARYERHLLFERLTGDGARAKQRLARGLGLRVAPASRVWAGSTVALATAAAATALAMMLGQPAAPADPEFGARNAAGTIAPSLFVYRMVSGAAPVLVRDRISRDDELAFAYSNPASKKYLWIFGVDEHHHVYWYYPAWSEGMTAPGPLAALPGPGPHELPEAVRHAFDGSRLELYAFVSDEALAVTEIEARLAQSGASALPGGVRRSLEVAP